MINVEEFEGILEQLSSLEIDEFMQGKFIRKLKDLDFTKEDCKNLYLYILLRAYIGLGVRGVIKKEGGK